MRSSRGEEAATCRAELAWRAAGSLAYEHSRMVATCSLPERQVAIACVVAQPVNVGRQSQEVRLSVIVLEAGR